MLQTLEVLTTSLRYIQCGLTNHVVSKEEEERLFNSPEGFIETECQRCHFRLILKRDPADRDNNYYMLMEER